MKKLTGSLIVLVVVGLALGVWALTHTERPVAGATFVGLVSGCRLEMYGVPLQPQVTARLACPGQDWIQLWPLPMVERLFAGRIDAFVQQLDLREAFEGMIPRINMP